MPASNRSDELIRLTYCSTATFNSLEQSSGVEREVARILMESRRNNPRKEIGGVLHYGNGYFFQALEGRRQDVNERYEKIVQDKRHRDVELLAVHAVDERMFPDWSMKYVSVEARISDLLAEHGMDQFQPYQFDEDFCEQLIQCFVKQPNADQGSPRQPGNREPESKAAGKPFWKRIFGG